MDPIPFRYVSHCVAVPVRVGRVEADFIFDSGIGVTLISDDFAATVGSEPTGATFTGRRMSGQELEVPLARLESLEFGGFRWTDVEVAVLDMGGAAGMAGTPGFLSLSLFDSAAVTVDYPAGTVVVEDPSSLAERAAAGTVVPVEVERDGPSSVVYMSFELPCGGKPIRVEVDMGSDCLILDSRFARRLGIDLEAACVERVEGTDETGYEYSRYYTKLEGVVHPAAAPNIAQRDPDVLFQHIIHDGLLGTAFLREFSTTFDVPSERIIFGPSLAATPLT